MPQIRTVFGGPTVGMDGENAGDEGKPGLSKSWLEWPIEVSAPTASAEDDGKHRSEKPLNPADGPGVGTNSAPDRS